MLSQHWKPCRKWPSFNTTKALIFSGLGVIYLTWPAFVCTVLPFCYTVPESDKYLLSKVREDIVGGLSIVFTRKVFVDETHTRMSTNVCKSIVGIDSSQLYFYSMSQLLPTGLHTRYEFDADLQRFKPRQSKS